MRYTGTHTTTYRYSAPVFLQPHKIRLRPRSDPGQILQSFSIEITPTPDGTTEALDAWGNNVTWAWFSGHHASLEITTRFVVDRLRVNPYDFIVTADDLLIPPSYDTDERAALVPYFGVVADPSVRQLADDIARSAEGRVLDFANLLASEIHDECRVIVRRNGPPLPAAQTLAAREGSCRDLAVLYVEACRHVGIAARFVSGYVEQHMDEQPRELHAWAGVYLPGAGWRGYDPTQGLAVSTGHITLATAAAPTGAAPVTGSFAADGVVATLDSRIEFEVVEPTTCDKQH